MFNLASLYHPLTAQAANFEGCMPCAVLKPFVANYWGTEDVSQEGMGFEPLLVVPDTCMDVIFTINHTTGVVSGELCGMGETAMVFPPLLTTEAVSTFAIRFYFWSIHFYSGFHLRNTAGNYNDADLYFKGWKSFFTEMLLSTFTLRERIEKANRFLLSKLDTTNYNHHVMNALYHIIKSRGVSSTKDACAYTCISQRQLERLFQEHIGTTVKKTTNLVRYQNLWHDIVYHEHFDVQDAVSRYGFCDQSHLINSFGKYHKNMTISEAKKFISRS